MVYKNVKEVFLRSVGHRSLIMNNIIRHPRYSSVSGDKKKLTINNVFSDNPLAKYWVLGALSVASGITYYFYNNQKKKKLFINLLPPSPSHFCFPRADDVDKLKVLLESAGREKYPKQVQISGPPGSGKTQLARLLAESINDSRRESFKFKLWPKDEVTASLLAHSKDSLLLCLKQLAAKLGWSKEDLNLNSLDLELQLDVVSQAVKDKLMQKSNWILVVDDYNTSEQLKKWLPDPSWGKGYVVYTILSEDTGDTENETKLKSYNLHQLTPDCARQLFLGVVNESETASSPGDPPENILKLLHHNPLALAYAAVYFKSKVGQGCQYSYQDLYSDLDEAVRQLNQQNPDTSELLNVQTSSVALATRAFGESTRELLHVFDFLGSCNPRHPVPFSILSCHLKTPEYLVQIKSDVGLAPKGLLPSDEDTSSLTVTTDLKGEQSLWSVHGIVSRVIKISERIKLEIDALKALFGYGGTMSGDEIKPSPDGLKFVRSCPLLIRSCEAMADVEVISIHPVVHNVFQQIFVNQTIPFLERQHLLIAERKHQQKSYFGRLRGFDPQKAILDYHKSLGDIVPGQVRETLFPSVTGKPNISSILGCNSTKGGDKTELKHQRTIQHLQEHFNRVVSSFSNHYRNVSCDDSGMVEGAMLLPHLKSLLHETWLTATSKGQVYRTMAHIYSDVLGEHTTSNLLLTKAYLVYQDRYGENSLEIAGLLVQQANLCSISEDHQQSKALLERAVNIYQKDRKVSGISKQPFEYGKALVALGVNCASLGEIPRSKDLLEKGLMELQNAAPNDPHSKENKWFAAEISSAVTNLGHAYLSLGQINQGRKLLELALIGHQNVHGDIHSEVVRALTTLSIAHAMQGNNQESKRLRNEAGKIRKRLDTKLSLFLF